MVKPARRAPAERDAGPASLNLPADGLSNRGGSYVHGQFDVPDIADLAARLRFSPDTGRIWLDDKRMVLMHTRSIGALRQELIETLGLSVAKTLMMRTGYASGAQDAELAVKVRGRSSFADFFLVGPQLHALEGLVKVEPVRIDADAAGGKFFGEFLWHDSAEDEIHIQSYGIGNEPACWMQIGYASGYTSVFMGRPILFREVECRATGQEVCRIIGKSVSDWGNEATDDLRYLQPQAFVNQDKIPPVTTKARPISAAVGPAPPLAGEASRKQLVGASAGFNTVCHMIEKVAATNATVLLLGESGVGKEMFAQTLHRISSRSDRPFVAINCAAIPEQLIESELFGSEKGAFTGAVVSREGRFERANGGTLFLDEIGSLALPAQSKVLRALQEREIERVGGGKTRSIDVRVVTATNEDLREAVRRRTFREDLFYRLNVFPITIPPLRERRADIPLLMDYFLKQFGARHGKRVLGFTQRAINALFSYGWPGNVRELENTIERGVILAADGEAIDIFHLFTSGENLDSGGMLQMADDGHLDVCSDGDAAKPNGTAKDNGDVIDQILGGGMSLDQLEDRLLLAAVERAGGNISEGARLLGITRPQLAYRLKRKSGNGNA